mgnify:FL=1
MLKYIVVEHLEPCISPWLLSEYSYIINLFRDSSLQVIFTNVRRLSDYNMLKEHQVHIFNSSITSNTLLKDLGISSIIVLDPKAEKPLRSNDAALADAIVIGGIMGDHPPKGRTWELITSRMPGAKPRNLGKKQLTIAGAAYVLKEVLKGIELDKITIREGLTITLKLGKYELLIELPYAFPYVNDRPVLPRNYVEVVARKSLIFEGSGACRDEHD